MIDEVMPRPQSMIIDSFDMETFSFSSGTVKLGNMVRFGKEQIGIKEPFPVPICHLLHKDKELLELRNNFRATTKFLIVKFDCIYKSHFM